jgi:hypothetical protein
MVGYGFEEEDGGGRMGKRFHTLSFYFNVVKPA